MKCLIVGHGIAGAMLGYFLEKKGVECMYVDAPGQVASTQVAAGIINPITGRRYVKSWLVDTLLPVAKATYQELEKILGISLYHETPLIRCLFDKGEENDWEIRKLDPDFQPYIAHPPAVGHIPAITHPVTGYFQPAQTAQVQIGSLVEHLAARHKAKGVYREVFFDHQQLTVTPTGIQYQDLHADHIIFCEGWRVFANPFFSHLPFQGNKGEVLLVKLPEVALDRMVKHKLFVVPMNEGLYWIGSASSNRFTDEHPTAANREYLINKLKEVLITPFEVVDHQAAVRPTISDRRPCVGMHPNHPRVWIFNGLGTKGTSIAPWLAQHFSSHLLEGTPLDSAVDVRRFFKA
ncbi:MAG: FAD-binding oxidoreductase [Saprospiraceae bacterium]